MARGRFISNSISTSKKFAQLASHDHRLMYLMLVPHVDAEGRHDADPLILNGQVYTLLGQTATQVDAALADFHAVGLIILYRVDTDRYLEITNFHEHNKVRRKDDGTPSREAPSRIPPASTGTVCDTTPQQLRSNSGVALPKGLRVKSKELSVKSKGEVSTSPQTPTEHLATIDSEATPRAPEPRTSNIYEDLRIIYNAHRGLLPEAEVVGDKRKAGLKSLLAELRDLERKHHRPFNARELLRAATLHVANDTYWIENSYNLDNLLVRGRVIEKAEKWKASGTMSSADRRLVDTASRVANAIGGLDDRPN